MRWSLLAVVVGMYFVSVVWAYDWSTNPGDGSAENPYQISTAEQLTAIGSFTVLLAKSYILTNDIDLSGQVFTQAVIAPDLNNTLNNGFQGTEFSGIFDGKGYRVCNLAINTPDQDYIGLFGSCHRGQIKNLGLINIDIKGRHSVGGLAGINDYDGVITDCYSAGTIYGNISVGGLVGKHFSGKISNCYSVCSVYGGSFAGGLIGYNCSSVTSCYSGGPVSGVDNIGGLVGYNDWGGISNCFSTGSAHGASYVGGLAGYNKEAISNSYSIGVVTGSTNYVGGLVGYNYGVVRNCYWNTETSGMATSPAGIGKTTAQMKTQSTYTSWAFTTIWYIPYDSFPRLRWDKYSGGTGSAADPYQINNISDFYDMMFFSSDWSKSFILNTDIDLQGLVFDAAIIAPNVDSGSDFQGIPFSGSFNGNGHKIINITVEGGSNWYLGLFGFVGCGGQVSNLGLENCQITGEAYSNYIGALIGYNCYSSISNCYADATVSGDSEVGGLIGYNEGGVVNNCHTTGTISATSVAGGLAGENFSGGSITNCYTICTVNGYSWIGGLVGYNSDLESHIKQCYSAGTVAGSYYLGGLIGTNEGEIDLCYSINSINKLSNSWYVGGLAGSNNGSIRESYSNGNVNGYRYVGGLTGYNFENGYIQNCYTCSYVRGNISTGGLIGFNDWYEGVYGSFWNMQACGQFGSAGGEGKMDDEMMMLSTFTAAGWDFAEESGDMADWRMLRDGNGYPQLAWAWQSGFSGDGSAENPYQISTAEQMSLVGADVSIWDKCFVLMTDISMGYRYNIIGDETIKFTGCFDGNNHTITDFTYVNEAGTNIGLFGYIGINGIIKNLTLENVYVRGQFQVGAIAGTNDGQILNCIVQGTIEGEKGIGGCVGVNKSLLKDCTSNITIYGNNAVGGLAGHNGYYGDIEMPTLYPKIIESTVQGTIQGYDGVGGLTGINGGTVYRSSFQGTVEGHENIGGLIGHNSSPIYDSHENRISECFSQANARGIYYIGGLIGRHTGVPIVSCYTTGTVEGNEYVGGLAGEAMGSIDNCYSLGAITGSGDPNLVGGLIGYGDNNVSNSYWDIQSSGLDHSSGGIGKTTADMKTLSTFTSAGWDFANTWDICEGTNYPRLQWQVPAWDFACPDGVSVEDLGVFTEQWLMDDCSIGNNYCGGVDIDASGAVNLADYSIFAQHWLEGI